MSFAAKAGGGIVSLLVLITTLRLPFNVTGLDFIMLVLASGFVGIVTYALITSIMNN